MSSKSSSNKKLSTKKIATKKVTPKKSTPKKPVAKKIATKKTTTKKVTVPNVKIPQKTLTQAPADKHFWVTDGQILADLYSLADSFAAMEKLIFTHHVSKEKNDFADWVEHVLCDSDCANELRSVTTPKQARTVVVRHLRYYQ